MFIFLLRFQVYITSKLSYHRGLKTYLNCSIYMDKDKLPAQITVKQQLGILSEIKNNLEDWELEIFRASCFEHFLNLDREWTEWGKQGMFTRQYVHFLMLRRMRKPIKKEMWFLIEGKPAMLSIKEFTVVIGLWCHSRSKIPTEELVNVKSWTCIFLINHDYIKFMVLLCTKL